MSSPIFVINKKSELLNKFQILKKKLIPKMLF